MKNLLKCGLALAAAFSLAACSGGSQSEDTTKIGIIQLAEHPALDQAYEGFMDGLKEAGYTEENTTFDYQNASNDLSNCDTIAQKLVNDGDDLIYAIATPAAQSVSQSDERKFQSLSVRLLILLLPDYWKIMKTGWQCDRSQ